MTTLRRVTSSGRFIPEIDGLRFIAIASVMLFHLQASLGHDGAIASPFTGDELLFNNLSKRGVELFFVISGFVLGLPFAKRYVDGTPAVRLKDYFLRRLSRLEPPYILNLIFCATIMYLSHRYPVKPILLHLLASVGYLDHSVFGVANILNVVIWSLEVEVQFYCVMPLLAFLFAIRSQRALIAVLVGSTVATSWLSFPLKGSFLQPTLLYYVPFFLAGLVSLNLYLAARYKSRSKSILWDLCSLVGWPLVWTLKEQTTHFLLPLLFIFLVYFAFHGRFTSRLLSLSWLTNIGGMCYTIYLYHFPMISILGRVTKRIHIGSSYAAYYALQGVLILPVVLIACMALFLLIERPCMDRHWPSKVGRYIRGFQASGHTASGQEGQLIHLDSTVASPVPASGQDPGFGRLTSESANLSGLADAGD